MNTAKSLRAVVNGNAQAKGNDVSSLALENVKGNDEVAAVVVEQPHSSALATFDPVTALSYSGAGTLDLEPRQRETLTEEFPDDAYEVKPTGEVYVSQVHYRRRLNAVFGPGAWAMVPRSGYVMQNDTVCREYALYVRGVFVAEAIGETDYQPTNERMSYASAAEGAKSSALTRCCKDLGIASECWSKRWTNNWRAANCVQVWRKNTAKPQWRLRDAEPWFDETGPVQDRQSSADHAPRESRPAPAPRPAPTAAPRPAPSPAQQTQAPAAPKPAQSQASGPVPPCATCGHNRSVIKSKRSATGAEFYCFPAKGGCGATIAAGGAQ